MANSAMLDGFVEFMIEEGSPTALLLTGDIANGETVAASLAEVADLAQVPIFFV